jgi:hypothetical protein
MIYTYIYHIKTIEFKFSVVLIYYNMAGGLLQLVAYGAQDVYISGNPQITLFKVVYRRHTNFAMECFELSMDSAKPGGRPNVQVLRNGDLATRCHLKIILPELLPTNASTDTSKFNGTVGWVRRVGHALVKSVEIQIGGAAMDKHYGIWLDLWYELTHTKALETGYSKMIGDEPKLTNLVAAATGIRGGSILYIPLQFWFCRNYGLALPLIALQYHDVRFNIEFEELSKLVVYCKGTGAETAPTWSSLNYGNAGILVDYVFLDSEERRRFAQVGHEYLMEEVQHPGEQSLPATGSGTANQSFTLSFNHPCKELIWAHKIGAYTGVGGAASSNFLVYSNTDSWTNAIDAAAENLVLGMMTTAANGSATQTVTFDPEVTPIVTQVIGTTTFKFISVNVNASQGSTSLYVIKVPLLHISSGINLAASLTDVTVYVDFASVATGVTPPLTKYTASVSDHSLNILDLSVPLDSALWTDTRSQKICDYHVTQFNNYGLSLTGEGNLVVDGQLVLNGHERFAKREGNYFNYVQPWQHHTRTPADGVNVYSFALHPEQQQPTGVCNLSRIDNTKLNYKTQDTVRTSTNVPLNYTQDTNVYIFVTNYNVLRVMSGMAGKAYSN